MGLFAAELGEDTQRALGVKKADVETFGAAAALLVDEAHTLLLGLVESLVGILSIVVLPIMLIFPLFQKYYAKGISVGAVK